MKTLVISVVLCGLLALIAETMAADSQGRGAPSTERFDRAVNELAVKLNNNINFYGQVVDLEGEPVADAVVKVSVRIAGASPAEEFKRFEVKADSSGAFAVNTFGDVLQVDEIVRDGYQYRYKYTPERNFKSPKPDKAHGPGFDPDKPMVFRLRKLAAPAFVVSHNMTFGKRPGKPSMFDLIKRRWVHSEASILAMNYSSTDRDWHTDLLLSVEGEPGRLRLVMETPDAESGFVVEKHEFFEMMTEAPEHGYHGRVEVPVPPGESELTAYVKAQGGLFYARIHIAFSERVPGVVDVNATSFTNLSGARSLEYIPSVESRYDWDVNIDHVRKEIRRADLLSGRPIVMPQAR